MSETRDPALKLFGKTIQLPSNDEVSVASATTDASPQCAADLNSSDPKVTPSNNASISLDDKNATTREPEDAKPENKFTPSIALEGSKQPPLLSPPTANETPATLPIEDEETSSPNAKPEKEGEQGGSAAVDAATATTTTSSSSSQQEKPLKKADKILSCPRCNSMDTKFCYFNNYNTNQPRHFCKSCQRYWTAGGTMRNVPVGAGRRKNKNSSSSFLNHHRQIFIPEATNAMIYHQNPALRSSVTLLAFASDPPPLCESMVSALNLVEKSNPHSIVSNRLADGGSHSGIPNICSSENMGLKPSTTNKEGRGEVGTTITGASCFQGFSPEMACFPPPPWGPHPWNPAHWTSPVPSPPPVSAFLPSGIPVSVYASPPPPYWRSWSLPWLTHSSSSSADHSSSTSSGHNSPTLGKHTRNGNILAKHVGGDEKAVEVEEEEEGDEKKRSDQMVKVLVPKTLRINDPNEAAKSSIWGNQGISKNEGGNNEGDSNLNKVSLFRGFESKEKTTMSISSRRGSEGGSSRVLQANPAASSRSLTFRESADCGVRKNC